jgi:hypothetical protein
MWRLVCLTLAIPLAIGNSAAALQTGGKVSSNVQSQTGVVKTVSASSLTIERGGHEFRFAVDSSTRVLGKTTDKMRAEDLVLRQRRFSDFVKPGDQVMVKYRQLGRVITALEVLVNQS